MQLEFTVPDMACASCAKAISDAVLGLDSSASVEADPNSKRVAVETRCQPEEVAQAIRTAGYTVE